MTAVPLGALPAITYLLLAYVVRPAGGAFAPVRLALTRAAVLVGAAVAVLVEVLSAVHALTVAAAVIAWSVGLVAAGVGVVLRYRRDRRAGSAVGIGALVARARCAWAATGRVERILLAVLAVQIAAELVIAVVSPPNNYDSQTYHLPKIEHWVVQRDVSFYPTSIDRQLSMAPGAEYLLLQLRLLTGGDALYNLLQLAAGLGCALLAARIAGQLGGSVRAQLLTAFVVGTTPMVALESTSTQTDLVVAAWVAALATLVLDELDRRTPLGSLALLGTGIGLVVLTKATGAVAAGPLLLYWLVVQARRGVPRALAAGALTVALALVVAGPFLQRSYAEYGNPLGPPIQRDAISMQRHDPPAILVNTLRIAQNVLQTPSTRLNNGAAREIERLSRAMGVNPDDRSITFWGSTFPAATWLPDEDKAAFPVEALLVLGGAVVLLTTRRPATVRWYAALFWVSLLGYVATVKWQPWGNRLILFLLVLGAPLAGLWLDALARARWRGRRVPAVAVTVALVLSGCAGLLAVGYGWPRRLVGPGSVFTVTDLQARFQRRPQWLPDYEWAAAAVRASGARRVGLVQGYDTWEYPWWLLLPHTDIVSLRTLQPGLPAADPRSVGAVLCVSSTRLCDTFVPAGWTTRMRDGIGYALPPSKS